MELHERIKAERELRHLSQDAVAKAVGITQPAYRKIESGETMKSRFLREVLAYLGIDQPPGTPAGADAPIIHRPPPEFIGTRDLKVYSAVEGGRGELVVDTSPIDIVARPWYVANVPDAYAVVVVGESMVPAFKPGMLAIINPKLPVVPGEPAIFTGNEHSPNGDFRAMIKELVRQTATEWIVHQWNPPPGEKHELRLKKKDWPKAQRVVGSYYR